MARDRRARSALISGSPVGPSAPQFQELLPLVPSRLSSPLAWLCFVVVGDQVAQGEAVVDGDQVDRGGGPPPGGGVQVGGAGEAVGELADPGRVAAPEVAHRVAVLAVRFPPQRREPAQVVAVGLADVPRFGDEFGP